MLRSFLYLDRSLLDEWIEQLLGAIPGGTSTHRESGSQGGQFNGGVRVGGIGVGGERTNETSSEWVSDWQLTDIGEFERLYRELGANVTKFSGFDSTIWTSIKGREIIETEGNASIPEVFMKAVEMPALTSFWRSLRLSPDS